MTVDGVETRDVAVVGAGPAGIAAAARAAESGARVIVVDEGPAPGGQIWRRPAGDAAPPPARAWLSRLERSGAHVLDGATVYDAALGPDGATLGIERAGRPLRVRARAVVIATGARERFLPFPGWTLPGVIGVGGAQALSKQGASFDGRRVVVAGSGALLLPVAASLAGAGAHVALVAEQAPSRAVARFAAGLWRRPRTIVDALRYRAGFARTPYRAGTWVAEARGDDVLREVVVTDGRRRWTIACDVLCTGYGLVPNVELASLLGCAAARGAVVVDARQATTQPGVFCAGEPTGVGGVDLALVEGEIAGLCAVGRDDAAVRLHGRRAALRALAAAMDRAFAPRPELRALATADTIVCRCEDVTLGALGGCRSTREAKLLARVGMGPCQGRVCGAALEVLRGWEPDTVRPPVSPVLLSTLLADPDAR